MFDRACSRGWMQIKLPVTIEFALLLLLQCKVSERVRAFNEDRNGSSGAIRNDWTCLTVADAVRT